MNIEQACLRIVLIGFGLGCSGMGMSEPVELEVASKPAGVQMTAVDATQLVGSAEVSALLDPADCDPYMHVYILSTQKCVKIERKSRPYSEVLATSELPVICRLSNNRYFNLKGPVDENAPCYGRLKGKVLRGEVVAF